MNEVASPRGLKLLDELDPSGMVVERRSPDEV